MVFNLSSHNAAIFYLSLFIPTKLYLGYLPFELSNSRLKYIALSYLFITLLYIYHYLKNPIFLSLFHIIIWGIGSILLYTGQRIAGLIIAGDCIISIIFWFYNKFINYKKEKNMN